MLIPKDKVVEIVQKRGKVDIAGIASDMIASGYTHPASPPVTEGEKQSPFTRDLEEALATLMQEGKINKAAVEGKNFYAIDPMDE